MKKLVLLFVFCLVSFNNMFAQSTTEPTMNVTRNALWNAYFETGRAEENRVETIKLRPYSLSMSWKVNNRIYSYFETDNLKEFIDHVRSFLSKERVINSKVTKDFYFIYSSLENK